MKTIWNCSKSYKISSILIAVMALAVIASPANAGLWVDPNIFDVNIVEGGTLTQNLTVGNDGVEDLDFIIRTHQVGSSSTSSAGINSVLNKNKAAFMSARQGHDFTALANAHYKPDRLIVRFAGKANGRMRSKQEKNKILKSLGEGKIKRNFKIVPGLSIVELPPGQTVKEAVHQFNKAHGILYAEPDYEVQVSSTVPDDTRFNDLWGMHNTGQTGGTADADIDAPEAWDIGTGSSEIIVAVIDTGVDYTHPDLAANMWVNEAEYNGTPGVDDDGNGYVDDVYGYDFRNNDGDPMDDHYHGTHVSGTIGGIGNNGEGVAGVSWKVKIMGVKFLSSSGSGWTSDAIKCIEYTTLMGANVSSNSWGGGGYNQGLKDAIDAAGAAGMLFIAAAGNSSDDNDSKPHYPSSYDSDSLIAVMATDHSDNKAGFSSYGSVSVDLGAPGVDILSCKLGGGYHSKSGTSMATPHVAGACALLWSMNPDMSNDEVKDILLRTGDQIPALAGKCVSEGRLNLYKAILETKAPWIKIHPETGTIGAGESNDISITFDATELTPGTYEAGIVIIPDSLADPIIVPVTMTVTQDDLQITPSEGFESSGTEAGPFKPECVVYTLTNINGTESVNWTTLYTEDWLEATPSEGLLGPGEVIDVNVCISANADLLDPNLYTEILTFQNTDSNSIKPRPVTLTVKPPDCFTESFGDIGSDLSGLMVTFIPDGTIAYYEACREEVDEFPTDPCGGTYVGLWDDDFVEIFIEDTPPRKKKVSFYGTEYDRFYIGSNGYITFGDGDTEYEPSLENHFNMLRISGVFADLTPPDDHCISYKKFGDRTVVTYQDVPLFGGKDAKTSFQIEMFYVDGKIRITWLDIAETACVAGLSQGRGLPPVFFEESNLNKYPPCWPLCDFDRDYSVYMNDLAIFVSQWLNDDCSVPYWCQKTDLNFSGDTDFIDFAVFGDSWGVEMEKWWLWPVSNWEFDEGQGDIAYDSFGNNDGTLEGDPQWVAGKIGDYALDFDGNGDYVQIPADSSLELAYRPFTFSAWVHPQQKTQHIFTHYQSVVTRKAIHIKLYSNGKLRFAFYGDDLNTAAGVVPFDTWTHVACTYDYASDTSSIYVNGVLQTTGNQGPYTGSTVVSWIGKSWTTDMDFDGKIDDVSLYDRALSDEEIRELYGQGADKKASSPNPVDGATGADPNGVLSWVPGYQIVSHDVYFGTDYNDVNDATPESNEYMGNYDVSTWDPCGLEIDTLYYWRIDEPDGSDTYKGDVWSFTTWLFNDPNLVSRWAFDEGSGTDAYDWAGSNHGTLYGDPIWTTGQINGALNFDGNDDYVLIPSDPSMDFTGSFTISAWLKPVASPSDHMVWFVHHTANSTGKRLHLRTYYNTGMIRFGFYSDDLDTAPGAMSFGSWNHVVVTYDYNSDTSAIYVDGVLNVSGNNGPYTGSVVDSYIGRDFDQHYFDGTIDDVRVYDRALTAPEILQLYQDGL